MFSKSIRLSAAFYFIILAYTLAACLISCDLQLVDVYQEIWLYEVLKRGIPQTLGFFMALAVAEEGMSRFVPLTLTYFEILNDHRSVIQIIVVTIVSCLFGYWHGGYVNILLQGVVGVFLSMLFISLEGPLNFRESALACIFTHFAVNVTIAVLFINFGFRF